MPLLPIHIPKFITAFATIIVSSLFTNNVCLANDNLTPITKSVTDMSNATQNIQGIIQPPIVNTIDLQPIYADYKASLNKGLPINGTATRTLKKLNNGQWQYQTRVDSFIADIEESTIFSWDGATIKPNQYTYSLSGWAIKDRKNSVTFDWNTKQAVNRYKKRTNMLDMPDLLQDRLSYQLQLRLDLLRGKTEMAYHVIGKGKIKEHRFKVVGEEVIHGAQGDITTVVVEKIREKGKTRETTLWFAKDWDFMLVKFLQVEPDGETYEIMLKRATIGSRNLSL